MNIYSIIKSTNEYEILCLSKTNINKSILNSLRTVSDRRSYMEENGFEFLGEGTGRIVYLVNPHKAIKIANNVKGLAQNKVEFENLIKHRSLGMFPKPYDKAPDDSWIEVEFVRAFDNFDQVAKVLNTDIGTLMYLFSTDANNISEKMLNSYEERFSQKPVKWLGEKIKYLKNILNNDKLIELIEVLRMAGLPGSEFRSEPSHFGQGLDGRLVITDSGLSQDVYNTYYKGPVSRMKKLEDLFKDPAEEDDEKPIKSNLEKSKEFEYGNKAKIYNERGEEVPEMEYISKDPKNVIPSDMEHRRVKLRKVLEGK